MLTVNYRKHFHMDRTGIMDLSKIGVLTRFQLAEYDKRTHAILTEMNLGTILFNHGFYIDAPNLRLFGDVNDTKAAGVGRVYSAVSFVGGNITLKAGARLKADKFFIFARNSFEMERRAQILSDIENECFDDRVAQRYSRVSERDHYECMGMDLH